MLRIATSALAALWLAGCVAGDVDLSAKECPCATGWYCDRATRTCRPGLPPDDAGPADGSGGLDADLPDAGPRDSGGFDAAPRDAGSDAGRDAGRDAGHDGGTDAGAPDAGPDDTRCDDVHSAAVFCDGLEAAGFAAWTSTFMENGFVGRATDETFLGMGSLYAQTDVAGGRALARYEFSSVFGSGDDVYMRAWAFVPSGVSLPSGFTFFQAAELPPPFHHLSISLSRRGTLDAFFNSDGTTGNLAGGSFPRDTWFCVEAHVHLHDTAGSIEYWLNGTSQDSTSAVDTLPAAGYGRVMAGVVYTPADQPSARIYMDEIVVDDRPIGCD